MGCGSFNQAKDLEYKQENKSPSSPNAIKEQSNSNQENLEILATMGKFDEFFITDFIKRSIKTKNKFRIKFKIKNPNIDIDVFFRVYNSNNKESKDIQYRIIKNKDYFDFLYIFRHKGKYKNYIFAKDTKTKDDYDCVAYYEFDCQEEWGNKKFIINEQLFDDKNDNNEIVENPVSNITETNNGNKNEIKINENNSGNKKRKNILELIDKEKLKKLVSSCKKRTDINLKDFLPHFKEITKNLTNEEKAYALFNWIAENILYDVEGFYTDITHDDQVIQIYLNILVLI